MAHEGIYRKDLVEAKSPRDLAMLDETGAMASR